MTRQRRNGLVELSPLSNNLRELNSRLWETDRLDPYGELQPRGLITETELRNLIWYLERERFQLSFYPTMANFGVGCNLTTTQTFGSKLLLTLEDRHFGHALCSEEQLERRARFFGCLTREVPDKFALRSGPEQDSCTLQYETWLDYFVLSRTLWRTEKPYAHKRNGSRPSMNKVCQRPLKEDELERIAASVYSGELYTKLTKVPMGTTNVEVLGFYRPRYWRLPDLQPRMVLMLEPSHFGSDEMFRAIADGLISSPRNVAHLAAH